MISENFRISSVSSTALVIEIIDPSLFEGQFNIGSYVKVPCRGMQDTYVVGVVDNYRIKDLQAISATDSSSPSFLLDVKLVGMLYGSKGSLIFKRGGHGVPLPPNNGIGILTKEELSAIYSTGLLETEKFTFSSLVTHSDVKVPINGDKFFNKHFAIVGATGSGKSHTVAKVLQSAISAKSSKYSGLNNSHIVLFDIHGEYSQAFPECNYLDSSTLSIPYWLFDGEELMELFIESSESNSYNQVSQFRHTVIENKKIFTKSEKVFFDSPLQFDIKQVKRYIQNMNSELVNKKKAKVPEDKNGKQIADRIPCYFNDEYEFDKVSTDFVNGPYTGEFDRFLMRLENTINNPRLGFLFKDSTGITIESVLQQFLGYGDSKKSNVTVIDLSGIPFEVLSITVSLISRLIFEFGYYYKRSLVKNPKSEAPILLVYEEAHKYVPRSDMVKYRASKVAIERIAKEGRKYGVTLGIVSQRPSEVSETIFSQCSNYIAMRLTNPDDQAYVKKLLPDTSGDLIASLPVLQSGEALIIGDSISLPSMVLIDTCSDKPNSTDIAYLKEWSEEWRAINFPQIITPWKS
ncbi:ATP-binding protein [Massilia aurea]|uniref:ATP-binding protein n=1 Tax=Massilia aurea TaxID=373040 RepID=UPI0021631981|nr:ATP-binding protein [Massilia aurea]MCS0707606.1 ATP-binding protein [Massilia aurea]